MLGQRVCTVQDLRDMPDCSVFSAVPCNALLQASSSQLSKHMRCVCCDVERCRCTCRFMWFRRCWCTGSGCSTPSWPQTLGAGWCRGPSAPACSWPSTAPWPGAGPVWASSGPVRPSTITSYHLHKRCVIRLNITRHVSSVDRVVTT